MIILKSHKEEHEITHSYYRIPKISESLFESLLDIRVVILY